MIKSKKPSRHLVTEVQITLFIPKIKEHEILKEEDYGHALVRIRPGSAIFPVIKLPDYITNEKDNFPNYRGEFLRITRTFNILTREIIYTDNKNLKLPSKLGQSLERFLAQSRFEITRDGEREYMIY
ncbi:hypothetical protein HY449_04200 [Candidatus Pacearchaeota archaeon]|nr:hypothetical protein [Candidatus Pacearchaeota archaeon]